MARRLTGVLLLAALALAGCTRAHRARADRVNGREAQDARTLTMERLQSERLPALNLIEPWDNEYSPGLKLTTDHYEIYTTYLEPLLLRSLPGFIESAYWGYNDQLPQPITTVIKFKVYLFADWQQWEQFTRAFAGEQASVLCRIKTGAYYLNGACVVYNIGPRRTLSALGHEGWHQFNSQHFKYRLPSWLDEGVAMLFEASKYQDGVFQFDPGRNVHRLSALRETLDQGRMIPLRDLITTSPGEVIASNQAATVMAFYSQSYALVRFLREAGSGRHVSRYHRLLWDGLLGEWPLDPWAGQTAEDRNLPRTTGWNHTVGSQLFTHYIGGDFDWLEQEYLAYCRRIARDVTVVWDGGDVLVSNDR